VITDRQICAGNPPPPSTVVQSVLHQRSTDIGQRRIEIVWHPDAPVLKVEQSGAQDKAQALINAAGLMGVPRDGRGGCVGEIVRQTWRENPARSWPAGRPRVIRWCERPGYRP
jgi:hypothetical protein